MAKSKPVVLLSILLLLLISIYAVNLPKASACSCAEPPTIAESLELKTAIFAGKVTSISGPPPFRLFSSGPDPVTVTLEVSKVWKGELGKKTTISTAMSSESCGYDRFSVADEYLIFAYRESGNLETGICEGTKLLSSAANELKELGSGYPPVDGQSLGDPASSHRSTLVRGSIAVLVLILVLGIYFYRKKRKRHLN
ncbi:hypothetical protein [Paenibacillus lactis]|uniref:hypothetical protein n=1 Tax=Paenibacillus lactis TaxID=228574 RepID=UPI0036828CC4